MKRVKRVVNVEQNLNADTGTTTYKYEKESTGLTLVFVVDNIDDNGVITMSLNHHFNSQPAPEGSGSNTGGVQIFNLNKRDLKSGAIRYFDGQTLILTGVITETQFEEQKWPILVIFHCWEACSGNLNPLGWDELVIPLPRGCLMIGR